MPAVDRPSGASSDPSATPPPFGELWVDVRVMAAGTVLAVRGEVDLRTAPVLAEHVERHFGVAEDVARRPLVFDLTEVDFLGSAGLGVLVAARRRATTVGGAIWVVAASRAVSRPIEVTGLFGLLNVVSDLASALDAIG
ncbi:MAG TPA: STAS domain-containing protein [Pseudonocardiaceae bacterium]|nr:STAS domain-containing protein [Pseudonocardiaceae bacterium]